MWAVRDKFNKSFRAATEKVNWGTSGKCQHGGLVSFLLAMVAGADTGKMQTSSFARVFP